MLVGFCTGRALYRLIPVCKGTVTNGKRYQHVHGGLEETFDLKYFTMWAVKGCVLTHKNVSAHQSLFLKQHFLKPCLPLSVWLKEGQKGFNC